MRLAREKARLAADLYDRIWSQRLQAVRGKSRFDIVGAPNVELMTISLPDGLRIAFSTEYSKRGIPPAAQAAFLVVADGLRKLEFIDRMDMGRCDTSIIASQLLHAAGYTDAPNGRPVVANFANDYQDILPRSHARKRTENYLLDHLDGIVADAIAEMTTRYAHATSFGLPSGLRVMYIPEEYERNKVWVTHDSIGTRLRLRRRAEAAYAAWRLNETVQLLAGITPPPISAPPDMTGSARLTQALRLCHQALQIDPDLQDLSGTPLRPLLERDVPELLRRHRLASDTADARDTDAIDAELEQGISRICGAIDEGLSRIASDRRNALREQLAFLEMRHPAPDRLLGIAPGG